MIRVGVLVGSDQLRRRLVGDVVDHVVQTDVDPLGLRLQADEKPLLADGSGDLLDAAICALQAAWAARRPRYGLPADAPSGDLPFTDGAFVDAGFFATSFPYLNPPIPGSPSEAVP